MDGSRVDTIMELIRRELKDRKQEVEQDRFLRAIGLRVTFDSAGNVQSIEYQANRKRYA